MAKKEISGYIKLQINGGQANPAPPVGPALGQRGINIMDFCKAFNEKTKSFAGKPVPVIITVYKDKKFDFVIKSPPASHFIKEAAKLKSGSQEPGRNIVAKIPPLIILPLNNKINPPIVGAINPIVHTLLIWPACRLIIKKDENPKAIDPTNANHGSTFKHINKI